MDIEINFATENENTLNVTPFDNQGRRNIIFHLNSKKLSI